MNGNIVCPLCRKLHTVNPFKLPKAINIGVLQDIRQSLNEQRSDGKKEMCRNHSDEELKMLCVPCQKVVCLECLTDTHKDHEYIKVTEFYERKKEKIDIKLSQLEANIIELATADEQLQSVEETMIDNGEILKSEIATQADDLISRIATREQELIETVDTNVELKVQGVRKQRIEVLTHMYHLVAAKQKIAQNLEEWDKVKMAANSQQLLDMATDTQTTGLVKEAGKASPELDIVFKSQQVKENEIIRIVKKSEENKIWRLCQRYIPSPEFCKHLIVVAVFTITVVLYHYYPLLGIILAAFISLHTSLEYSHTDKTIRVDEKWCKMPAILSNRLKVLAILVGAFTGVLLFYYLPWLYYTVCVLGLFGGLCKAIEDSVRIPLTLFKSTKVFSAITGTVIVVLIHYYIPWIGWWVIGFVVMCVITESIIYRSVEGVEAFSETAAMVIGVVMVFSLMILQFYVAEIIAGIYSCSITSSR